jgi:hypothetical protein
MGESGQPTRALTNPERRARLVAATTLPAAGRSTCATGAESSTLKSARLRASSRESLTRVHAPDDMRAVSVTDTSRHLKPTHNDANRASLLGIASSRVTRVESPRIASAKLLVIPAVLAAAGKGPAHA